MTLSPYPYQSDGARWLTARAVALLADQYGLGKTVTALLAARARACPCVVLCPASAIPVWRAHAESWRIPIHSIHSYAKLPKPEDIPRGAHLILDECHYLKTPTAKRTQAMLALCAHARSIHALSATPAPNHAGEMFVLSRLFGLTRLTYAQFLNRYCILGPPVVPYGAPVVRGNNPATMPELRALWKNNMLRRLKRDVLPDLPPLQINRLPVAAHAGGVLAALQQLEGYAELCRLADLADKYDKPLHDLVAASVVNLAQVRRAIGTIKAPAVADWLSDALDSGLPCVVVMAWHKDVLDILQTKLERFGVSRLDGASSPAKRKVAVEEFQAGKTRVFIGNIQAAGTAITLTRADTLVFAESSWVPGDNAQAANRIHRIGQKSSRGCQVHVAYLAGSVDDAVARSVARKLKGIAELGLADE